MREMKDSGVEWIGEIPIDWEAGSFGNIIIQNDGGVWGSDPNGYTDSIVLRSTEQTIDGCWSIEEPAKRDLSDIKTLEYYRCRKDDLLITKSSGSDLHIGKTTIVDEQVESLNCYYSNFIQRVRVKSTYSAKYYWYVLNSDIARAQFSFLSFSTSGLGNINSKTVKKMYVPFPSTLFQHRIADYLDVKCAQIDRAIARQQEAIEKLKEYKLSVITEAVTKGLNPDVPMKDSGIEWIGEIPEHWGLPSIKRIARLTSGGTPDRGHPEYWNGEIPWIKTGELKNDFIFDAEEYITEMGFQSSSARVFDANTILMAMYGQGKTRGMTGLLKISAATNQACCGITVNNDIVTVDYLWIFLIGSYEAIRAEAAGSGQPNLNAELIYGFHVTVPPLEEQADIYNFLINIGTKIDSAIKKKEQLIDKLTEYKKSLIYEVVTGKREV